jgi:hypothetical protein
VISSGSKHYSIRTEQAYVGWARRYILFHDKRHPREMGAPEIAAFLIHLALDQNVAASTQNQALCALLFLYRTADSLPSWRNPNHPTAHDRFRRIFHDHWHSRLRYNFLDIKSNYSPAGRFAQ